MNQGLPHINWISKMGFYISIGLTVSCTPFQELSKHDIQTIPLEVSYENKCDSIKDFDLWAHLGGKICPEDSNLTVQFSIDEKGKLLAKLFNNDSLCLEKILKGKFKNDGAFYQRRKFSMIPFFPIFYGYSNQKMRLYRVNDQLFLEESYNNVGGILFMAGGNKGTVLAKINQSNTKD